MNLKDFDWRKLVASVSPTIGVALGGPLGGIAGGLVAKALGAPDGATDNDLNVAAQAVTPDQLLALKQADIEFEKFLADSNIKLEDIAAKDRADAREMQKASKNYTPAALTFLITAGFFGLLIALLFREVPKDSQAIVNIMVGSLGTAWIQAISFWYGTTRDSSRKTELLAQSSPTPP